jgi:hypothetical protein
MFKIALTLLCWACKVYEDKGVSCKSCDGGDFAVLPEISDNFNSYFSLPHSNHVNLLDKYDNKIRTKPKCARTGDSAFGMDMSSIDISSAKRAPKRRRVVDQPVSLGVKRLRRFQHVMYDVLYKYPKKDTKFDLNDRILRILTATHLEHIVGKECMHEKAHLYTLIDPNEDFSTTRSALWSAARQQGKTTTLARFIAALSMCAITDNDDEWLLIYSIKLKQTKAIITESRGYLDWVNRSKFAQQKLKEYGLDSTIVFKKSTTEGYIIKSLVSDKYPSVFARPGGGKGNRGDSPTIIFIDEFVFISSDLWINMISPLLAVDDRTLTMATTPGEPDSHIEQFIQKHKKENKMGKFKYRVIDHTLMCDNCYDAQLDYCCHNLFVIPPWKSLRGLEAIKNDMPKDMREHYMAEMYGRRFRGSSKYFNDVLLKQSFMENPRGTPMCGKRPIVYISVDPGSHDPSCSGFTALVYNNTSGKMYIIGGAEVKIGRADGEIMQMCVRHFTKRVLCLKMFRKCDKILCIPIVEIQNCEVLGRSISSAISSEARYYGSAPLAPMFKKVFKRATESGIHVFCSDEHKLAMVLHFKKMLMNNDVIISDQFVTMGNIHLNNPITPTQDDIVEKYMWELTRYKDDKNGKITGKWNGSNDDMSMSLLQGCLHSDTCRTEMMESKEGLEYLRP